MNYRHAYHAGNFADVFKHIVLLLLLDYLRQKDKPFFALDTHAGVGLYDLQSTEALKTGEAAAGIGRLWNAPEPPPAVAAYLALVRGMTNGRKGELRHYPGSPVVIKTMLRPQDRLVANELHPEDNGKLRRALGDDARIRVTEVDGYQLLKSQLPPAERRGLVLVDPPFETGDDFRRMTPGLEDAARRWSTGIYAFWYPVKDSAAVAAFHEALRCTGIPKILATQFMIRPVSGVTFDGCGLVLVNAPWTLRNELAKLLLWLSPALDAAPNAGSFVQDITGE